MKAVKFSQYLQPREQLRYVDAPHWIYVVEATFFTLLILAACYVVNGFIIQTMVYYPFDFWPSLDDLVLTGMHYLSLFVQWGGVIFALIYFIHKVIFYMCTIVFASDRRLFVKTGLVRVEIDEVSFDEIRKININYGLFGRFLGYGRLDLDARFVSDSSNIPYIYDPEIFMKLIHYDNDLNGDISLSHLTKDMNMGSANQRGAARVNDHLIKPTYKQVRDLDDHSYQDRMILKKNAYSDDMSDYTDMIRPHPPFIDHDNHARQTGINGQSE